MFIEQVSTKPWTCNILNYSEKALDKISFSPIHPQEHFSCWYWVIGGKQRGRRSRAGESERKEDRYAEKDERKWDHVIESERWVGLLASFGSEFVTDIHTQAHTHRHTHTLLSPSCILFLLLLSSLLCQRPQKQKCFSEYLCSCEYVCVYVCVSQDMMCVFIVNESSWLHLWLPLAHAEQCICVCLCGLAAQILRLYTCLWCSCVYMFSVQSQGFWFSVYFCVKT